MRLLDILFYLLRSSSKVTVRQLFQAFNVSIRTIRRDLGKLSVSGIPIIFYRGANGGVEIDKNYTIAIHILRYSDYKSLIFVLDICKYSSNNIGESCLIDKFKSVDKVILINKIHNVNICNKSYNGIIINYEENKDKIKFI